VNDLNLFDEDKLPTRADIIEHAKGDIYVLDQWLDTLALPVGFREKVYSDLESYRYEESA
jgi:hypothetical protein